MTYLGDPEETALRYYRLNFGGRDPGDSRAATCPTSTSG